MGPGLEPISGRGIEHVTGFSRQMNLGGGKPVHIGDAGAWDVGRGLAPPEQRRDRRDIGLRLARRKAES